MGSITCNSTDLTAIYNACVAKGVTPASKSVADIANAVSSIPGDTKHTINTSFDLLNAWINIKITNEYGQTLYSGVTTGTGKHSLPAITI